MGKTLVQHKSLLLVMFLTLLCFTFSAVRTASAKDGPMDQLQVAVDEVLKTLQRDDLQGPEQKEKRSQLVLDILAGMFDFREMARSSLGPDWNNLTETEQDNFVGLFKSLIRNRYIGSMDSYSGQKVIYKKERIKDDRAIVSTAIIDRDTEISIDYRLRKNMDKWLIYDLRIENVSLIVNYRRDFGAIMRKEQFAGLVDKITKQIEKSETAN